MARVPPDSADGIWGYGLAINVVAPTGYDDLNIELERSSSGSTSRAIAVLNPQPDQRMVYRDVLPNDGENRTYRARCFGRGYQYSAYSNSVTGKPYALSGTVDPQTASYEAVATLQFSGPQLNQYVTMQSSGQSLALTAGYQSGSANGGTVSGTPKTWADGAAVTFPTPYGAVPVVRLYPGDGTVYREGRSAKWTTGTAYDSTAPQYVELAAVSVTKTGFSPRARLIQRSTALTLKTNNFAGGALGNTQTTNVTLSSAPSYNDSYTARYTVNMALDTIGTFDVTAVVAVLTDATGSFVERKTKSYNRTLSATGSTYTWANETMAVSAPGMVSTDRVQLKFKSLAVTPGSTSDVTVTVKGSTTAGVTYYKAGGTPIYAAMCPTTLDVITWVAQQTEAITT